MSLFGRGDNILKNEKSMGQSLHINVSLKLLWGMFYDHFLLIVLQQRFSPKASIGDGSNTFEVLGDPQRIANPSSAQAGMDSSDS